MKADGFEGERTVIVPLAVAREAAKHPLLRGLRVTDAGFYPRASGHGIIRPQGAAGAVLIICREGSGWVRPASEARLEVRPGEAVILAPGLPHAYGASEADPWTIQWTHFEGDEMAAWWQLLRLPREGGLVRLPPGLPEKMDLGRVHERLGYDTPSLVAAASALRWALSNLRFAGASRETEDSAHRAVEAVEKWMREHCAARVTLVQLARKAGLSPSHFSTVFRRQYGFPPVDYVLRLRIQRACRLLSQTKWPVRRVGEEVGFSDPLHFSRRFSAVIGIPPRRYRERTGGEAGE